MNLVDQDWLVGKGKTIARLWGNFADLGGALSVIHNIPKPWQKLGILVRWIQDNQRDEVFLDDLVGVKFIFDSALGFMWDRIPENRDRLPEDYKFIIFRNHGEFVSVTPKNLCRFLISGYSKLGISDDKQLLRKIK